MDVPIIITDSEKTHSSNEWRTYSDKNSQLTKHRGQGLLLILVKCTQFLKDKINQDTEWNMVSTSYYHLTLYMLIENTVLGQTEDQYPFATVYNQELGLYAFRQDTLSKPQWYKRFNTRVDVGEIIGMNRQHKVLLEYVAQELHTQTFSALTKAEQLVIREDAEERYLSYALLRQI